MVGVEQGVKLVKKRFRRVVFVAVHLVENYFALFGYLALGNRGMLHDVKEQVHGAAVVLDHKACVEQGVFLAGIGVQFAAYALKSAQHVERLPARCTLKNEMLGKVGETLVIAGLVARPRLEVNSDVTRG